MSITSSGVVVEIAPTSEPLAASPTWVDVSEYVSTWSIDRGRTSPHMPFTSGSISVVLDNSDRRFDRTYTSGPYYDDQFDVGMRMRVRETIHGETLAVGWVDDWPMAWNRSGGTVTMRADDLLRIMADAAPSPGASRWRDREMSGVRIGWTVSTSGLFGFIGALDLGQCGVPAQLVDAGLLEHAQLVAESDGGVLLATKDGTIVFHDRLAPIVKTRQNTPQWTFSPSGAVGTIPYSSPQVGPRRAGMVNSAAFGVPSGDMGSDEDATSIARYGVRSRQRLDLICESVTDAQALAEMHVGAWATPGESASITLDPVDTGDDAYEALVTAELRDLVTVEWAPGNASPLNSLDMTIESISLSGDATRMIGRLGLFPARLQTLATLSEWALADGTFLADGTSKVAI